MPRPLSQEPTQGELEILTILWDQGPAELGAVCRALREYKEVATTTVATMLKVMMDKELVKRAKGDRGYLWSSRVSRRVTQRKLLRKLISSAFEGSAQGLVAHMVADGKLSAEDREEILRMLSDGPDPTPPGAGGKGRSGS